MKKAKKSKIRRQKRKNVKGWFRICIVFGIAAGIFWGARSLLLAPFFTAEANAQKIASDHEPLKIPGRGVIYDRNFKELAVSFQIHSIYAFPTQVIDPDITAEKIASVLKIAKETVLEKINLKRNVVWLAENINPATGELIQKMELPGIKVMEHDQRYYPQHFSAAHVVGFVNENRGIAGVECYYDPLLSGGVLKSVLPDSGILELLGDNNQFNNLVLTLDLNLQKKIEHEIATVIKSISAKSAGAVLLDINSGEILSLVNSPTFDPNQFWEFDAVTRKNQVANENIPASILHDLFTDTKETEMNGDTLQDVHGLRTLIGEIKKGFDLPTYALAKAGKTDKTGQHKQEDLNSLTLIELVGVLGSILQDGRVVKPHLISGLWDADNAKFVNILNNERTDIQPFGITNKENDASAQELGDMDSIKVHIKMEFAKQIEVSNGHKSSIGKLDEIVVDKEELYQTVLVSSFPAHRPRYIVGLLVDGTKSADDGQKAVDSLSEKIVAKIGKQKVFRPVSPQTADVLKRHDKYFAEWQSGTGRDFNDNVDETQVVITAGLDKDIESPTMPDVKGYSLRKALQELQQLELEVQVDGSGWVMEQNPPSGGPISSKQCYLRLGMSQMEMIRTITLQ